MKQFTKDVKAKGWTMKRVAARWSLSPRRLSQIAKNPGAIHKDALAGLPDTKGSSHEETAE